MKAELYEFEFDPKTTAGGMIATCLPTQYLELPWRPGEDLRFEALAARADGRESVKLEDQLIVTADGPEVISFAPHDSRLLA